MPTFTTSAELPASAPKMWQALKDSPVIIPKIAPHAVASMDLEEGSVPGLGSIRIIKLGPKAAPMGGFVKEKLTAWDNDALTMSNEEIEGGHLVQGFTKWAVTIKFTPVSDSSCKWEETVEYEGGEEASIAKSKENIVQLFNGLAAYVNST